MLSIENRREDRKKKLVKEDREQDAHANKYTRGWGKRGWVWIPLLISLGLSHWVHGVPELLVMWVRGVTDKPWISSNCELNAGLDTKCLCYDLELILDVTPKRLGCLSYDLFHFRATSITSITSQTCNFYDWIWYFSALNMAKNSLLSEGKDV